MRLMRRDDKLLAGLRTEFNEELQQRMGRNEWFESQAYPANAFVDGSEDYGDSTLCRTVVSTVPSCTLLNFLRNSWDNCSTLVLVPSRGIHPREGWPSSGCRQCTPEGMRTVRDFG